VPTQLTKLLTRRGVLAEELSKACLSEPDADGEGEHLTGRTCLRRATARGRREPTSGPDSSPETCHSKVRQGEIFERAGKNR
jgi:hypothetical protein